MRIRNQNGVLVAEVDINPLLATDGEIFRALQSKGILRNRSLHAVVVGADGVWDDRTGDKLLAFEP